jgi:hypothetical protein
MTDPTKATRSLKPHFYDFFEILQPLAIAWQDNSEVF